MRPRGGVVNYTIVAVGKLKERFWKDACAEYVKRLGAYGKVKVVEVPDVDPARAGGVEGSRAREGQGILAAIPARSHVVLLAIEGKERSSEDFSRRLDQLALGGQSDVTFVIGGSDGVCDEVRARADETLSFGPITWPAWCSWSRSTAPARSPAARSTTSRRGVSVPAPNAPQVQKAPATVWLRGPRIPVA